MLQSVEEKHIYLTIQHYGGPDKWKTNVNPAISYVNVHTRESRFTLELICRLTLIQTNSTRITRNVQFNHCLKTRKRTLNRFKRTTKL